MYRTSDLPGSPSLIRSPPGRAEVVEGTEPPLLAVIRQYLLADLAELGAVLLQTGQHRQIIVIHMRPAEARHVARAGVLAVLGENLRGHESPRGHKEKGENEEPSEHLTSALNLGDSRKQSPPKQRCQCAACLPIDALYGDPSALRSGARPKDASQRGSEPTTPLAQSLSATPPPQGRDTQRWGGVNKFFS